MGDIKCYHKNVFTFVCSKKDKYAKKTTKPLKKFMKVFNLPVGR